MTLFRANHNKNYVVVNNTICKDARLSLKAKGLWLYAFSKPDDWTFNLEDMVNNCKDGKDAVRAGLSELIEFGYLKKERDRRVDGTLGDCIYTFYEVGQQPDEEIQKILPKRDFPILDKPTLANPTLLSIKETLSIDKNKTEGPDKSGPVVVSPEIKEFLGIQDGRAKPKSYACLKSIGTSEQTNVYLTEKYDEVVVEEAIKSMEGQTVLNVDAFMKVACKNGYLAPGPKKAAPQKNLSPEQSRAEREEAYRLGVVKKNTEAFHRLGKQTTYRPEGLQVLISEKDELVGILYKDIKKAISLNDDKFEMKFVDTLVSTGCKMRIS